MNTNRRLFLRSTGTLLALPWLDAAFSAIANGVGSTEGPRMLRDDLAARQRTVNDSDRAAWAKVLSRADWEKFAEPRIAALRRSLGQFPAPPEKVPVHVTRTIDGDGFQIENLVYESRAGIFVTANLYLPANRPAKMPAIVIIHSHHNPKTQSELQDMGMTWARAGCAVLVPDQPGYGERRDHAAGPRQDYRFRYFNALQLHTIGDSLIGWMAWDTSRGLDVMMQRLAIDTEKVILLGSVAGGGDPAAVIGAVDRRFTCVGPFNFGGPQPETRFPIPEDADAAFNYLGGGSWESTRNLLRSGSEGFFPWTIVAGAAPRRLIYGHEFAWDREHDPVWRRLEKIYAWYGVPENLAFTHGHGRLALRLPEASHCNNIGLEHRKLIHTALEKWFGIRATEYSKPLPAEELRCLTPSLREQLAPWPAHEVYARLGAAHVDAFRAKLEPLAPQAQRALLQAEWTKVLGSVTPRAPAVVQRKDPDRFGDARAEKLVLEVEPGIVVPVLLALPQGKSGARFPVVLGVSQHGMAKFLSDRADAITALIAGGAAVCLPDVRGTGETSPEGSRDRQTEATSLSATEMMLGGTLLGARLRDVRSVLAWLRTRTDVDGARVALWGDSFASANTAGFADPLIGEERPPHQSEPLGALLGMFGALFEDDVKAVVARGGFAGYQALLRDRFCYVPHDAVVPGALTAGDLADVALSLASRPLRLEALVDGRNVALGAAEARKAFLTAGASAARSAAGLEIAGRSADAQLAAWLLKAIK